MLDELLKSKKSEDEDLTRLLNSKTVDDYGSKFKTVEIKNLIKREEEVTKKITICFILNNIS